MKFITTGKSLKELLDIYGTGSAGFYIQDWYKDKSFFTEKPEAGTYEIDFDIDEEAPDRNKTYVEQCRNLKGDYKPVHVAILAEAILFHYKTTGKRLLKNTYSRTSSLFSGGRHVNVGIFVSHGLNIDHWRDVHCYDFIGVASARKIESSTLDSSNPLESAIKTVKEAGYVIYKQL